MIRTSCGRRSLRPVAPFGAPQKIAPIEHGAPTTLAVGADGRAVAVFTDRDRRLVVAERAPAGAFAAPAVIDGSLTNISAYPAAVVRPDGAAIVAWWSPLTAALTVRTRERPGAFGPPISLVRPRRLDSVASIVQQRFSPALSSRADAAWPHATLAADGRVAGDLERSRAASRRVADRPWRRVRELRRRRARGQRPGRGSAQRRGTDAGPAGGRLDSRSPGPIADPKGRSGACTSPARASPAAPEPAAPKVTVAALGSGALRDADPLSLRVTCDAACDVYAQIAGEEIATDVSLAAAGSRRLELRPNDDPIAPRGGGKVRVVLRSSAPGGHRATARTLTFDLRRAKTAYAPRVLGLTVAVDGKDLVVRWHTAKPAAPRFYSVWAFDEEDPVTSADPTGRSRRNFTVRIRNALGATKVTVYTAALHEDKVRRTTVEIQG